VNASFLGDSLTGAALTGVGYGYEVALCSCLGWTKHYVDGYGGSGFCNLHDTGHAFIDRLPALLASSPDIVVVEGGTNDSAYDPTTTFRMALAAFYAALRAGFAGPLYVTASYRIDQAWFNECYNAAIAAGAVFIDWGDWSSQPRTTVPAGRRWLTGTGDVITPKGDGNRDVYMGIGSTANHTHYGAAGCAYIGHRMGCEIKPPVTGLGV
jgi:hypothetical protein